MELNIHEEGLGFSSPSSLGQSLRCDVQFVNDSFQFCAISVHSVRASFSCLHEKLSSIEWTKPWNTSSRLKI